MIFRDQLNVALGPNLRASLHSLGDLKHKEMRDAGRHINRWARDILKIGESRRMTYNAEGALIEEDQSAHSSLLGSEAGSA